MTLADLRKLAIRQQQRVRFSLANGLECVVDEHGVARVPALQSVPQFNLEQELAAAGRFHLDAVSSDPKQPVKSRAVSREELEVLASGNPTAEVHDHEDE